jgi:hypothetical protein
MTPLSKEEFARRKKDLAARSERFYEEKLRALLEPAQIGKFLAVEPEVARYFLGPTALAALDAAREALTDKIFYLMRVGYKAAHVIGGSVVQSKR